MHVGTGYWKKKYFGAINNISFYNTISAGRLNEKRKFIPKFICSETMLFTQIMTSFLILKETPMMNVWNVNRLALFK